ncbi:hypothetical protein EXN66_Car002794 [Channa argus]|uniref:Immunoglobulin V-set domain-containing protein n=1 Tax=Channa argus TaxID=215402 RepID=A0A6G1PA63_CHAAH|nr:hypothetical protein EXN66_Car002794 [Channa argus]
MDCRISLFLFALMFGAAAAGGLSETKSLIAKIGDNITLNTGISELHRNSEVYWVYGPTKDTIIHFENGKLQWIRKDGIEKFELDERTGSLIIRSLNISDSGIYHGHIIDGNDSQQTFVLTVLESDPNPTFAGCPQNTTARGTNRGTQRSHIAVCLPFVLLGLICIVKLMVNKW